MHKIIHAEFLAPEVKLFRIHSPKIAGKRRAGQFVIIRVDEHGERIPLTIADSDKDEGSVTIIVQGVGKTTKLLNEKKSGEHISDIAGPLGKPSEIKKYGTVIVIGGGVGTAIAYPTAVALKKAGNNVISIIGARNKELIILEKEMEETSDELFVTTDDGSYGMHGFVTDKLSQLINESRRIDFILAIGPIPMMKKVAEVTKHHGIKTVVSLNPIMVDGTGMCGGCRAIVDNKTVFVCIDGPEFDAHKVDFENLTLRNKTYLVQEKTALEKFLSKHEEAFKTGLIEECKLEHGPRY
jgi:ferredoxin--NADP+ reductase